MQTSDAGEGGGYITGRLWICIGDSEIFQELVRAIRNAGYNVSHSLKELGTTDLVTATVVSNANLDEWFTKNGSHVLLYYPSTMFYGPPSFPTNLLPYIDGSRIIKG